ncbi:MAG TPA: helix-turn-helix transcriptional regulator [Steroidobacteraceae bacterium]|nr:helix-turn-helix transcriptional regulator [Steroidobacteraceae bacterium]
MQSPTLTPLVHFAGIALGLLLVLLLVTRHQGTRAANRWLAAFVSCLALLWTGDLLVETRAVLAWPWTSHSTDWMIFLVGPCLWMYVRRLTQHRTPSFLVWLVHAVPAATIFCLLVPFYFLPAATKVEIIAGELAQRDDSLNLPLLAAAVQAMAYWIACLLLLRRFTATLRESNSARAQRNLKWLHMMLWVTLGMWVIWALAIVLHAPWSPWLHAVTVVPGLYVLAFLGLRQPEALVDAEEDRKSSVAGARYARSGLDRVRAQELMQRLDSVMSMEKPWLESELTLAGLATRCGFSAHNLSQLLNEGIGSSFFDYINSRRVDEVKRCLLDPAYADQSILQIALASGFSSKTAFNTAFRQHTRITPSEFRRRVLGGVRPQST